MSVGHRATLWAGLGVLLLVAPILAPRAGHSQGNIELGPFRILPFLELSGEYNDNVLLAPRDEKSDFIWTISPGVSVELPGRKYAFRLGYRADILEYTDHSILNTVHHTVQTDVRVNFPGGLALYVTNEFRKTDDFAGFPVPELNTRVDRYEDDLKAGAEYTLSDRFALATEYRFFSVEYLGGPDFDTLNRKDHLFAATLFYRVLPKTSVLAEYNYQIINYDLPEIARDRDSTANKFKVGLKGDLTAKTSALIKVGAEFKDYDNPARPDWTGLILEGEVVWKYQEPSQLRLFGGRANIESTFQDNNFYVTTYGGLEVRHQLSPKLLLRVTGLGGTNDYPTRTTVGTETKKRSDTFYEFGAALRYLIQRWLSVELGYDFLVRDSNFDDFDYTNNRVKATVRLTF